MSAVVLGVVLGPGGAEGRGLGQPRRHLLLDLLVLLDELGHLARFDRSTRSRLGRKRRGWVGQGGCWRWRDGVCTRTNLARSVPYWSENHVSHL